jgi:hypothetical protein
VFRVEAGKVVAGISAPQLPEQKITDITKSGQVLTLKASTPSSSLTPVPLSGIVPSFTRSLT